MNPINCTLLQDALLLLGQRLQVKKADPLQLVVCCGSALIAMDLISMYQQLGFEDAADDL